MRAGTAALAWAVARVAAQTTSATGYGDVPVSYSTITVDECPTASLETMITITNGITVTFCPECNMSGTTPAPTMGPGYTTIYTTTYLSLCPTGTTIATYTVTESCTGDMPTWTPGPSHIPDGFTTTEIECTVCGKETPTITITEPCGCEATNGKPVPPQQTPVQQISDGQVQAPGPTPGNNGAPSNNNPAPTEAMCNGQDCGGSGNQSPNPTGVSGAPSPSGGSPMPSESCDGTNCGGSGNQIPSSPAAGSAPSAPRSGSIGGATSLPTTSAQCPGPQCRATATGGAETTGNSSSPMPFQGVASSGHVGFLTSIVLSVIVGGFAFAL